jgi:CreA protein
MENTKMRATSLGLLSGLLLALSLPAAASADQVGKVGVDWTGNDIIIDAVRDPKIEGITCHVTYFDRGIIDRLRKGNWFEDPSNNSIACRQTGPVVIGDIDLDQSGEEVFKSGLSLIWKSLVVTRVYDKENDTLIYLAHSREVVEGSAKMAISTVPLFNQNVTWTNGKPE